MLAAEIFTQFHTPFLLRKTRVNTDTREVIFSQQLIELIGTGDRFYENNDLSRDMSSRNGKIT